MTFSTLLATTFFLAASLNSSSLASPASPIRLALHTAPAQLASFAPDSSEISPSADEREFVERINESRTERGLYPLTPDPLLVQVARDHSWDMAARGYFNHLAPACGGRTPMDRYLSLRHANGQETPASLLIGENIYYCSLSRIGQAVAFGHAALMNSPSHRANILDPRYDRIGIGVYHGPHGQIWVTELFLHDGQ